MSMSVGEKLASEGWQRQSVLSEPRLSEAVELYESLGFEVRLVPVLDEGAAEGQGGACVSCFGADGDPGRFQVVYTRPRTGGTGDPPPEA
ncbi:MAG: hypothetical protein HY900_09180 [Deltaproteobacteria bacterium]|nr:hypothetical protein [Deltaproteobacteria bacterium]